MITRSPNLEEFAAADGGKSAYYIARWVNTRGEHPSPPRRPPRYNPLTMNTSPRLLVPVRPSAHPPPE